MTNNLQVHEAGIQEWNSLWICVSKANLLQSWEYGVVKQADGWEPIRLIILDNNIPIALVQCLTKTISVFGGIARINRGPVLIGDQSEETYLIILKKILIEAKKRNWWVIQIAPEIYHTDTNLSKLKEVGLRKQNQIPWCSGYIDLKKSENDLLMNLDGKWRNLLRKGIKLGVSIESVLPNSNNLKTLLKSYSLLQKTRGFHGLSEKFIKNLSLQSNAKWRFNLFLAIDSKNDDYNEILGHLVYIRHGDNATYVIGTTHKKGRKMQANSVLLWNAILDAKKSGCSWFDIGGLDANNAGVSKFKKGLNPTLYELAGEFRAFPFLQ